MPVIPAIIEERSKISVIHNQPLTVLIPYGSFIITCNIVFIALLSNILERWVLRLVYRDIYIALEKDGNERRRRSFTYYHVGAIILFVLLCAGVYPVFTFLVGSATFDKPIGREATLGDLLFLLAELYTAYYLYEMCFRTQFASPLNIAHHVGLLLVVQTAVVLFADIQRHPQATVEFFMCMVWGAFDVAVELPIFISMILWRAKANNHMLRARLGYGCCVWITVSACTEVVVTAYLLQRSWGKWGPAFQVITPMIFALWIVTQFYGAYRLFNMGRAEHFYSKRG